MKIELIGWRSEGLRCPDMKIDLMLDANPAHISLIQMPNGTAKTTTLTLIRAAMNGEASKWNSEKVMSFRRVGESHSEGIFILHLKIDERPLTFELTFDFDEGQVDYSTTSPSLGGKTPGHEPPVNVNRFFDSRFVRLFIFDGELAKDLLDPSKTEASQAIDALFQLYLLEDIKKISEDNWDQATKNKARAEKGLTQQRNRVKELQDRINYIKKIYQDKQKKLSNLKLSIEEHTDKINEHKSIDNDLREQLKEKQQDEINARNQVEMSVAEVMNQIRQPQSLHQSFTNSLIELKSKLDKAKLPEKASRQFFIEILEEKDCICGRELNEETRQAIRERAELYLSDNTAAFFNGLKEDIRNNLFSGDEDAEINLSNNLEQLQKNIILRDETITYCRALDQKLIEQGNDEVKLFNELLEKDKEEKIKIEEEIKRIERSKHYSDNPKSPQTTWCLEALKNWLEDEEQKLAEISGTVELRKRKEIFQKIIEKSLEKASQNLRLSIKEDCNEYLEIILHRDPIQIGKIDHSLHLKGQGRGSEDQTLSVGYTFLTTLLERGQNQFPLVVDSPANSIDANIRREIGKLIPQLCHQFIAFTILTEREGFTDTLDQHSKNTKFFTVFRDTSGTKKLIKTLPKQGITETDNCVIVEGKDYFDKFDLTEYAEGN